ncbi:MAG: hypothetical protein ABR530_09855 [Pyrinomonadaceae bacterium]
MMSKEAESADLIMKLYDLRREATMREARNWFATFFPENLEDVIDAMPNAFYRMVLSYWDMAAGFVNRGAIDEEMFLESNGEALMVFAKVEPYLEEVRTYWNNPNYLKNLDALAMRLPDAKNALAARRELLRKIIAGRAEKAAS